MTPRLLNKSEAARYCSMSVASFERICPVPHVSLGVSIKRWDVRDLDEWIDAMKTSAIGVVSFTQAMSSLNH